MSGAPGICAVASLLIVTGGSASAANLSDADVLAMMQKHCVTCHGTEPTHPAFAKPPKNLVLESIAAIQANAAKILDQVVEQRAMPLGNETGMTDDERDALARWIALPK